MKTVYSVVECVFSVRTKGLGAHSFSKQFKQKFHNIHCHQRVKTRTHCYSMVSWIQTLGHLRHRGWVGPTSTLGQSPQTPRQKVMFHKHEENSPSGNVCCGEQLCTFGEDLKHSPKKHGIKRDHQLGCFHFWEVCVWGQASCVHFAKATRVGFVKAIYRKIPRIRPLRV